jgi:hypothetical protein
MGKRELLLIVAFLAIGGVAYRVTAPADASGGEFSIGRFIDTIRSRMRAQNYELEATRTATAEVPASLTTLTIDDFRGTVKVVGEDRPDVSAELHVTLFGADEAQARQFEKGVTIGLEPDDSGHTLEVRLDVAVGDMRRRPRSRLLVRIPKRLEVQLGINGEAAITNAAAVRFDHGSGKAVIANVAGPVTGEFGPGSIEVDQAGAVELETRRAEARIMNVAGPLKLDMQAGDLRVRTVHGPTTLSLQRVSAEVEDPMGPVTIEGSGGDLQIRSAHAPVTVKVERMEVSLSLATPVRVDASTSGDTLEVSLPRGGLTLEAVSKNGEIRTSDDAITVSTSGETQHASHKLHGGGPLVKLETTRGDIVLR